MLTMMISSMKHVTNFFSWFWGEYDIIFLTLSLFVTINVIIEIVFFILHIKEEYEGVSFCRILLMHLSTLLIVGLASCIDYIFRPPLNIFRTIALIYYLIFEAIHVLIKADELGLPIPKTILEKLCALLHLF